jgi:hypothetical protein
MRPQTGRSGAKSPLPFGLPDLWRDLLECHFASFSCSGSCALTTYCRVNYGEILNDVDIKLLWGRAGGICSKPGCNEDLTALVEKGAYVVGEMAHVIGRKPSARRGRPEGGADTYDNLILLCPTHHTHIDKAPEGTYPEDLLRLWKRKHEDVIRKAGATMKCSTRHDLFREVSRLLGANKAIFQELGPRSETAVENPTSNLFSAWQLRRLDRILPNNRKILNIIDANANLLSPDDINIVEQFRVHAEAYEQHVFERLDKYPTFPQAFANLVSIA